LQPVGQFERGRARADVNYGLTGLAYALGFAGKYAEGQSCVEERLAIHKDLGVRDA